MGDILDDALAREIDGVEDFAGQRPATITDPASQVGVDLLGTKIVAAHFTGYRGRPQRKADKDAGNDGREEIAGEPRPSVAKRLK